MVIDFLDSVQAYIMKLELVGWQNQRKMLQHLSVALHMHNVGGVQMNPPFRENFFLHFQKLSQKFLADYVHSNPPLNPEVGPASG